MKVSLWVSPIVSVMVLFGSVGVATLTGDWVTGGRVEVSEISRMSADDVKGWMTLQQAADGLGMPVAAVIELIDPQGAAGLSPKTLFREVESLVPGFQLTAFRNLLRARLASPPAPSPESEPSRSRR